MQQIAQEINLTKEQLLRFYYFLKAGRRLDEHLCALWRQGKIPGGAWSSIGMEATAVGSAMALRPEDYILPLHRELGARLVKGVPMRRIIAQHMGRDGGFTRGREQWHLWGDMSVNMVPPNSNIAATIPVAVGVAMGIKYRREPRVCMVYFGDGATGNGQFHEALNMAGIFKPPVVFIVNNNQWAYSTPLHHTMPTKTIAERAKCYGFAGVRVDGNDVLEVYRHSVEAVERARRGEGPTMIECVTMRMHGHSEADRATYVPKEMLEEWAKKDPVDRFIRFLLEGEHASEAELAEIDRAIEQEIAQATAWAEASPLAPPESVLEGVYTE